MKATIFGSAGLLGHALQSASPEYAEVLCLSSSDLDLRDKQLQYEGDVTPIEYKDLWFNAAARVGGVAANTNFVGDFYKDNIEIGNNVLDVARQFKVKKVVSVLSSCVYPDARYVTYPLTEDQLHLGPPHKSNFGYAYAKRMLDVASRAYRQQWGCNFVTVIPNNLYGPHDNYDKNNGHVIPSLIRNFFEAHLNKTNVTVWGTGKPLREFTFSEDAAKIMWWIAENYDEDDPINIGNTEEISIGDLAYTIGKIIGFRGKIIFDTTKPEGQYRKPTSNAKMLSFGCKPLYTSLEEGLELTIQHFTKHYPNVRGMK